MSTSAPPAGHSMRQQLDELDALLQRMLTLPINQSEDDAGEPPVQRRPMVTPDPSPTPLPSVARQPRMMLLDGSAPVAPPQTPPAAWDPHWNINLNPQQGSSILGPHSPAANDPRIAAQRIQPEVAPPVWRAETVAFAPRPQPTPQPPLSVTAAPPIQRYAPAPTPQIRPTIDEPTPLAFLPLVALNRTFDTILLCFGPVGQWFCTSAGRNLLGYAGLLLLFGSAAWGAAGAFGWPR